MCLRKGETDYGHWWVWSKNWNFKIICLGIDVKSVDVNLVCLGLHSLLFPDFFLDSLLFWRPGPEGHSLCHVSDADLHPTGIPPRQQLGGAELHDP